MSSERLVRDRVPAIMRAKGLDPVVRQVDDADEFRLFLARKLREEVGELLDNLNDPEEYADVQEVLIALAIAHGVSAEAIARERINKRSTRGGFADGYIWCVDEVMRAHNTGYRNDPVVTGVCAHCGDSTTRDDDPAPDLCFMCLKAERGSFLATGWGGR